MTDIVERLRRYECANCGWEGAVIEDAADEIERLRKIMAGMVRLAEFTGLDDRIIVYEARTALEQK